MFGLHGIFFWFLFFIFLFLWDLWMVFVFVVNAFCIADLIDIVDECLKCCFCGSYELFWLIIFLGPLFQIKRVSNGWREMFQCLDCYMINLLLHRNYSFVNCYKFQFSIHPPLSFPHLWFEIIKKKKEKEACGLVW